MKALITGGTSGIGYGVASQLTKLGWDVTIVGRNKERGQQIAAELGVEFIEADLALMSEVERVASQINAPLDALVLCAGLVFPKSTDQFTAEGLETTFAINYLSRFALTQLLLPKLSANGSIVMLSGDGKHKGVSTDWAEPQFGMDSARRAALAVDLYAAELAQNHSEIRVYTCYPGIVRTNLLRNAPFFMKLFVGALGSSVDKGSAYVTRLITGNATGVHWNKDKPLQFSPPLPDEGSHLLAYTQNILQDRSSI